MLSTRQLGRIARPLKGFEPSTRSSRPSPILRLQVPRRPNTTASDTASNAAKSEPKTWIPPPGRNAGPILERRANRQLPPLPSKKWLYIGVPLFFAAMGGASTLIFNYQKASSSIVTSSLYALRKNQTAREVLGNEIGFASSMPWISGPLDLVHGKIDVSWHVKGTKTQGMIKLECRREGGRGNAFVTKEWSLTTEDGQKRNLLDETEDPEALARGDVTMKVSR